MARLVRPVQDVGKGKYRREGMTSRENLEMQ